MYEGTTILCLRREGRVVMACDGQVTAGATVVKKNARKIRVLEKERVLAGFAGATADAFTLFERFEGRLKEFKGNLLKAAVELVKEWRTDRFLRRLEAQLIVADPRQILMISGTGDVVEPDENLIAIGSGGPYAYAAARALIENTGLDLAEIAWKSMRIAADICVYTNDRIQVEELRDEGTGPVGTIADPA